MDWIYTVVPHKPRKILGISLVEYAVLDIVYKSQTHPKFSKNGMTSVGCHEIGDALGVSSGTVKGIFDRMDDRGYLVRVGSKWKYTTENFYEIAYLDNEKVQKLNVQELNEKGLISERKKVQKLNEKGSETERYKRKEGKVKGKEVMAFTPPSLEEVEALVLNSLRKHWDVEEECLLVYKELAKDYFIRTELLDWRNNKGQPISSLAGSVNTAVSNAKKWGEIGKMVQLAKRNVTQLAKEKPNEIKYDRKVEKPNRGEEAKLNLFNVKFDEA